MATVEKDEPRFVINLNKKEDAEVNHDTLLPKHLLNTF